MTAARITAALAALLVAAPAAAYVRSADPTTGAELFWPLPEVPYAVDVDRPSTSPGAASCAPAAADPALRAVRASFSTWRQQCSNLDLVYAGTLGESRIGSGGTSDHVVVFRRGWCANDPAVVAAPCYTDPDVDCGNIYGCYEDHTTADRKAVAYTVVLYDPRTGAIADADIELNGWDGAGTALSSPPTNGWYFTCSDLPLCTSAGQTGCLPACKNYGDADCVYMDLQNTVTHEAGHFIGLDHSGIPGTTMYAYTSIGETSKRILSPDDVTGLCAIYPRPQQGCSSAGGGAGALSAALALAAAALTRRGSRRSRRPAGCRR